LAQAEALRCWIRVGRHDLEVLPGRTLIGRHDTCQIVLDDPLVSRRHAILVFDGLALNIEDLGSINGVSVNERRVRHAQPLQDGDKLVLGNQVLEVHLAGGASRRPSRNRAGADTLARFPMKERAAEEEATVVREGEALETLSLVAEKMLTVGRVADAERILTKSLETQLLHVQSGSYPDDAVLEIAAESAVRLAEATGRGYWVDYVVALYEARAKLIPLGVVENLFRVVRKVNAVNLNEIRHYLARMQEFTGSYSPSEHFLLRRIEGLAELATHLVVSAR
jgi:hypothetical protein